MGCVTIAAASKGTATMRMTCRDHEPAAGGARPRDHPLSTAERARRWPAITNVPMPNRSRDPMQAGSPCPPEVPTAHIIEAVEIAGASDPEAERDEQIFRVASVRTRREKMLPRKRRGTTGRAPASCSPARNRSGPIDGVMREWRAGRSARRSSRRSIRCRSTAGSPGTSSVRCPRRRGVRTRTCCMSATVCPGSS